MKMIEMDPFELHFTLEHKNVRFNIRGGFLGDGRLVFEPDQGWDELCETVQQDCESLYEAVDETIYNAAPEVFEHVKTKEYDPYE